MGRWIDLCFENWYEEFGKLWPDTGKSQNLHFNGLLLTEVYNAKKVKRAKKVQRSNVSLYWRSVQALKEKWLLVS